jgi:hypothetical protein
MMSIDGLLRPILSKSGIFINPIYIPDHNSGYVITDPITNWHLNPFVNPFLSGLTSGTPPLYYLSRNVSNTSGVGHDFELLARPGGESGLLNRASNSVNQYAESYRPMALRGPLVVKGWGYDTNGYPVPNEVDEELATESGVFTTSGLTPKFLDNHLQKPNTWVTAPVDLRLDRERGVWTTNTLGVHQGFASGNIEHGTSGVATSAIGPLTIYNNGDMIWDGASLFAIRYEVSGVWYVQNSWSATRIRGNAVNVISPGTSGLISGIVPINGHYGLISVSAYLPTQWIEVQQDAVVWAELFWSSGTGSQWHIYGADCSGTGG